jgi:hypothetical protein
MSENLPVSRSQMVAALAANGASPSTIREELGLTAQDWKRALRDPESDIAQGLTDGHGRIVETALALILQSIQAGDVASAKWVFEKFSTGKEKQSSSDKIHITLSMPLPMADYMKLIEVDDGN